MPQFQVRRFHPLLKTLPQEDRVHPKTVATERFTARARKRRLVDDHATLSDDAFGSASRAQSDSSGGGGIATKGALQLIPQQADHLPAIRREKPSQAL